MNVLDLIIIYLASGSPFGVYQITKRQPARSGVEWSKVILSFLLWPAYAADLLVGRFVNKGERVAADRRRRVEEIRLDIEHLAFSGEPISLLFEFREIFYRYTGLSEAVNAPAARSTNEIFGLSGHRNKHIAERCIARRNDKRLAFHQVAARNEFVDLLFRLADHTANRSEVVRLAMELAGHLDDPDLVSDLAASLSAQPKPAPAPTSDLEKEGWKSMARTTSSI